MAFYILIEKVSETSSDAIYRFHDTAFPEEIGELRLDKIAGHIEMTKASRDAFFQRAAMKVAKHFREGLLPEKTEWAS